MIVREGSVLPITNGSRLRSLSLAPRTWRPDRGEPPGLSRRGLTGSGERKLAPRREPVHVNGNGSGPFGRYGKYLLAVVE